MNYAGLSLGFPEFPAAMRVALQFARRGLVFGSAIVIALIISGGIFTLSPLVGLRVAHTSGISMEPGLKSGDVVLIKDVHQNEPQNR